MNYGIYNYYLNGKPTGIIETFNVSILPDGSKLTESIRDAKSFKTEITVKTIERENKFQRLEIRFVNQNRVHAVYKFFEKEFLFVHENFDKKTTSETFDLPENCVIFPLMRCFQGQTILQVAQNQTITPVLVPDIQNPNDIENWLKPTFDERTAQNLGRETIAFYEPESVSIEANLYQYKSKHYDQNSQFWIDDKGLLIAYRFAQSADKIWEIRMESSL